MTIGADGDAHLACGGDSRTGVVLYVTADNETFHQLVDGAAPTDGTIAVVAGQQEGFYPVRYVVPLELALTAAEYYARHRRLSPDVSWEQY